MSIDNTVRVHRRSDGRWQVVAGEAQLRSKLERCLKKHPLGSPKHRHYQKQLDDLAYEG